LHLSPVLATSTPAAADTVVNGCTIVSNPTPTNFTNCAGAFLVGTNLSGVDFSYANLPGALFVESGFFCGDADCRASDLSGANFTGANLSGASLFGSGLWFPCGRIFCAEPASGEADLAGAILSGADLTGTVLVPSSQIVTSIGAAGAVVTWPTPPSLAGGTPGTCTSPSGSTFPLGSTTVTCQVS
jgi:hypothetical protein